jgi:hypothetical protein
MWRVVVRVLTGLLIAAATASVAYASVNPPTPPSSQPWWVYAAIVVLFVAAALSPAISAWRNYRGSVTGNFVRQVEETLRVPFVQICKSSGQPAWEISAHAFVLRRRRWLPWQRELQQAGRLSLGRPHGGDVHWTRGKGIIGLCWQQYEADHNNVTVMSDIAAHRRSAMSQPASVWDQLPSSDRLGLTHEEYAKVTADGVILACVIDDSSGGFRGCISLDAPAGTLAQMDKPEVWEAMKQAARSIWLLESRGQG